MTERISKQDRIVVEHKKDMIEIMGYLAMSIILIVLFLFSMTQITQLSKEIAMLKAEVAESRRISDEIRDVNKKINEVKMNKELKEMEEERKMHENMKNSDIDQDYDIWEPNLEVNGK